MTNAQEFVLERIVRVKHNPFENRVVEIDEEASDEGRNHDFNEWTKFQNSKGMAVASRADVYQAVKERKKKFIQSLRRDMNEGWVVLNPKHIYKEDSLLADIIHYADSSAVKFVICKDLFVPVWRNAHLYDVLETEEGLVYFKVSNGTKDNAKNIKKVFYELSGCKADETRVWTPDQESRKEKPERASGFYYGNGVFHVYGDNYLDYIGRSRGVCIGFAKKFYRK